MPTTYLIRNTLPEGREPMPLPANSRKLRTKRYEAWIGHSVGNGVSHQDDLGRFASMADAEAWVAVAHPDAEKVIYTFYCATDGWRPHNINRKAT